jgi:hypothetical protein
MEIKASMLFTFNCCLRLILLTINDPPTLTVITNKTSYTEGNGPIYLPRAVAFEPDTAKIER